MQRSHVFGFAMIPLVLGFIGWLINVTRLWTSPADVTLPWLCTALAVSVLILGVVCLVVQAPPHLVPARTLFFVYVGTLVLFGVGMRIDAPQRMDWAAVWTVVAELVGFAVVLAGVFLLSRVRPRSPA